MSGLSVGADLEGQPQEIVAAGRPTIPRSRLAIAVWVLFVVLVGGLAWAIPTAAESRRLLGESASARRTAAIQRDHVVAARATLDSITDQLAGAIQLASTLEDRVFANEARILALRGRAGARARAGLARAEDGSP